MARIRMAEAADAERLLAVYRDYIPTTVTFEYECPTGEEFARRVRHIRAEYPYLLCEEDGAVLGYAYAHRLRERAAYGWDAELSVYVAQSSRGRGVGSALYAALMELLQWQGIRNVYGVITAENVGSVRFHERQGFTDAGLHHRTGYKNGRWLDIQWMEKCLGGEDPPAPVRPIDAMAQAQLGEILRRYAAAIRGR